MPAFQLFRCWYSYPRLKVDVASCYFYTLEVVIVNQCGLSSVRYRPPGFCIHVSSPLPILVVRLEPETWKNFYHKMPRLKAVFSVVLSSIQKPLCRSPIFSRRRTSTAMRIVLSTK